MLKFVRLSAAGLLAVSSNTESAPITSSSPVPEVTADARRWQIALRPDVGTDGVKSPRLILKDRMSFYKVPALSVAIIDRCRISQASSNGSVSLGGAHVNAQTLFQAGSISKAITAIAVMRLVEKKRLSMDNDVGNSIPGWTAAHKEIARAEPITLRQLLSHTAGLNVHGFKGYVPGTPVPTIMQVLKGEAPANSEPVRLLTSPGSTFRYSGGGYAAVQALIMQATGDAFPSLMKRMVLSPLGMQASTLEQATKAQLPSSMARGHN